MKFSISVTLESPDPTFHPPGPSFTGNGHTVVQALTSLEKQMYASLEVSEQRSAAITAAITEVRKVSD